MNQEVKSAVKKTVKIAGVTCFALGGAALIASGAALKAFAEGAKYLKDTIQLILDEEPKAENAAKETVEGTVVETTETAEATEEVPAVQQEAPAAEEVTAEEPVGETV